MSTRILILFIVSLGSLLFAASSQSKEQRDMTTTRVRYLVNNLDPAVEFYTKNLGFLVSRSGVQISRCFREATWNWC